MSTHLVFQPFFTPTLLGTLAVAATGIVGYGLMRERSGFAKPAFHLVALLRIAGLGILFLLLLRPMREEIPLGRSRGMLAVLVDESRSMNTRDMDNQSRIEVIREKVLGNDRLIQSLREGRNVRYFGFGETLAPRALVNLLEDRPVEGGATDLGVALHELISQNEELEGVLVLSDGRDTEGMNPETLGRLAYGRGVPIFTSGVGKSTEMRDVVVTGYSTQDHAFLGEEIQIRANIYQSGFDGQTVDVLFLRNDEYVASKPVTFHGAGSTEVSFLHEEYVRGHHKFTVEVEPLEGEVNPHNNRFHTYVEFMEETVRVLLVEGNPHWDTRFLFQTLRSEPTLSVDAVFRLSETRYISVSSDDSHNEAGNVIGQSEFRFPSSRDDLGMYDLIILGRRPDVFLDSHALENLGHYVRERGGALLFARGRGEEELPEILTNLDPLVWMDKRIRDFRYRVTTAGEDTPIFEFDGQPGQPLINRLPSLISATGVSHGRSLAVVLAVTESTGTGTPLEEMAVMAYQRHGKGRVMTLAGSGIWQWGLLPPSMEQHRGIYRQFWGQIVRWLISGGDFLPGQDISFSTSRRVYRPGETVRFNILVRMNPDEYEGTIEVRGPMGETQTLIPKMEPDSGGLLTATYVPDTVGEYEAVLHSNTEPSTLSTRFSAFHSSREDQILTADHALLRRLSAASGGQYLDIGELSKLSGLLAERSARIQLEPRREDAWDKGLLLGCLAGLFGLEWLIRRKTGASH